MTPFSEKLNNKLMVVKIYILLLPGLAVKRKNKKKRESKKGYICTYVCFISLNSIDRYIYILHKKEQLVE